MGVVLGPLFKEDDLKGRAGRFSGLEVAIRERDVDMTEEDSVRIRIHGRRADGAVLIPLVLVCVWSLGGPDSHLARAADEPVANALEEKFASLIRAEGGEATVAVAFHDLATGKETLIRPDEPFHPASTIKVPVMMEVYRQASAGKLSLDDRLPVRNEFTSIADGSKYALDLKDDSELGLYKRVGGEATVRDLNRLMITESSNLATNLLVDRVTPSRATELMKRLGAAEVVVLRGVEDGPAFARGMNNRATARGLSVILKRLAERAVVSGEASEAMIEVLRGQKFNEGIPAGLPANVSVAHKTGSFKSVYHDAAIVEPPDRKPYVLVVLTRGIADESRAHRLVSEISRSAFAHAVGR
jgi:beta-lactamase class A